MEQSRRPLLGSLGFNLRASALSGFRETERMAVYKQLTMFREVELAVTALLKKKKGEGKAKYSCPLLLRGFRGN